MDHPACCLFLLDTLLFVVFTHGRQRFARFEGTSVHFNGLSLDESDISEIGCAIRCFTSTCRGIHFNSGDCKNLYETNDVSESNRDQYNPVSLTSSTEKLLINVRHTWSTMNPCHHGGVCEAVDRFFQCNCDGIDHYGPLCETGGNSWAAPDGWDTLHPELNLNLDDSTPYSLHDGAIHVTTGNGYGFKMNGNGQYVDLRNWSNDTCFVDVKTCEQGVTLFAYVKIISAVAGAHNGYISSMVDNVGDRYGVALMGNANKLIFEVVGLGFRYKVETGVMSFPTNWIQVMAIYTTNNGAQVYVDNVLEGQTDQATSGAPAAERNGHIVLGRFFTNSSVSYPGRLTVDWMTIWDRPLTEEERNLVHQD